jgi:hypothetical protein
MPMPKPVQMLIQNSPTYSSLNLLPVLGATLLTKPVAPLAVPEQIVPQAKFGGQQPPPTLLSQLLHPAALQVPVLNVFVTAAVPVIMWVVMYVEPPVKLPTVTPMVTPLEMIVDDEAAGQLDIAQSLPIWQQPGT